MGYSEMPGGVTITTFTSIGMPPVGEARGTHRQDDPLRTWRPAAPYYSRSLIALIDTVLPNETAFADAAGETVPPLPYPVAPRPGIPSKPPLARHMHQIAELAGSAPSPNFAASGRREYSRLSLRSP
jgi:hypothetical protein